MAILIECPDCRRKQSVKAKKCKCGRNIDAGKRNGQVRYWIDYRIPGGKQHRQLVGKSLKDAQDADAKRKVQKAENRFMDMVPDSKITFNKLKEWYLDLTKVKQLASYERVGIALKNFNAKFGDRIAGTIKASDLEEYQEQRAADGLAKSTIDVELNIVRGMVSKAFDNDKLDGPTMKAFRRVKNLSKRGANARRRTVSLAEYGKLLAVAPKHFRGMLVVGMNTGMRPGELRKLRWAYIDKVNGFIRLPADATKEGHEKAIPINHHVKSVLDGQLRHLHHDFVFTFGRAPITGPAACKGALRGSCKRAGVAYGRKAENGITMHDIRRTVKTNMLAAGVDKTYRDLILGHSLQGMDIHYIQPGEEALKQAMAVYTAWLDGQLENVDQSVDQMVVGNN